MKTGQLVREAFCKLLCKEKSFSPCKPAEVCDYNWLLFARAARRFVKAEQREKLHGRIRRQFKGKCKIVVEKGGYDFQDALKRADERKRK